ncbi:type II toxin-antitoxin system RelE/ParE family toxin [Rhizobium ruizarguesonis]|uniref:type II toxin-antitoxin system RelE/ParE family toxin n=1 Tax=Rhizobium ruizarguesonis TaxID=2081791 RepID=UPI003857F48F
MTDQNVGAAISQLDEIERQTDLLIDQPEIDRPGRIDGTRELIISRTSFIVIYRVGQKIKTGGNFASCPRRIEMAAEILKRNPTAPSAAASPPAQRSAPRWCG